MPIIISGYNAGNIPIDNSTEEKIVTITVKDINGSGIASVKLDVGSASVTKNDFAAGFQAACAPVLAGSEEKVIFVYADEYVPDCYGKLQPENNVAMAFACVLSKESNEKSVLVENLLNFAKTPLEFIEKVGR